MPMPPELASRVGFARGEEQPAERQPVYTAREDAEAARAHRRRYRQIMLAACVAGFVFALWNAWHQYFIFDEWAYWTERRRLLDTYEYADFFMRPHGDHWHSIIMAVWLPLGSVFGLKTYLPYVVPTILAHVAAGFLLFELLCHTRIRPAIAATTAILYLFLENAAGNVSFGWQIGFVAPIALCYLALLAIERLADGGPRWLAWLTVTSVLLAIVSSGVGITVMGVTTLAAAARRRLALAASILAVPGGAYVLWRRAYEPPSVRLRWSQLDSYVSYSRSGIESTLEDIAQIHFSAVAWLLLVGAVAGVVAAVVRRDRYWSVFAATLAGAVGFYALLSTQRYEHFPPASPRYVHVATALLLPSLAYLVDRLVSARRWMAFVAITLAVWVVVANMRAFPDFNDRHVAESQRVRSEIAATVALLDRLNTVSAFAQPYGPETPLRIGHVRRLADEGKLPCDADYPAVVRVAGKLGIPTPPRGEVSCRE